jgi:hypothetical protein
MTAGTELVPGEAAFVALRDVAPPESPFPGTVARAADGDCVLLVDRDALDSWPGWAATDEHVLAPLDVIRRSDGHDVVLPMLAEALDGLLARRLDIGAPLSTGEGITAAVSILRGLRAQPRSGEPTARAQWWLTDDGRPVLVEGAGNATPRQASADVLAVLAKALSAGPAAEAVAALAGAVADESTRRRELTAREAALFSLAEPEPIAMDIVTPLRTRARTPPTTDPAPQDDALPSASPASPLWHRLAGHLDAGMADAVSDAITAVVRRLRAGGAGRRRPIVVGAILAAAILGVGLLWPDGGSDEGAVAAPTPGIVGADDGAAPSDGPARTPDAPAAEAALVPEAALADLLERRRGCVDAACLAAVVEDPSRALPPGAIDAAAAQRSIRVVDDLGGLVVLAVTAASFDDQLVTIVGTDDEWRIRDAYIVADPPS